MDTLIIKKTILSMFVLSLASCSTPISKEGRNVRVINNPEFVEKCKFLGVIDESHYSGWNPSDNKSQALNAARNSAGKMGGDTIHVVGELFRGVQADVYYCGH